MTPVTRLTPVTLYTTHPSPLGELLLAAPEPGTLASVSLPGQRGGARIRPEWRRDAAAFGEAARQLDAYFGGELREFTIPLAAGPGGGAFRERVWQALDGIAYGSTVSYADLAAMAGLPPRSARAVGGAVGANPLSLVRPCHRVVGADGSLTGYAGGLARKRWLLAHEGAVPPGIS